MKEIILPKIKPEEIEREIGEFVIDSVLNANSTGCVIGLSGGIDSTTTAAIIKKSFDKYNSGIHGKKDNKNLELVGYMLPSNINSHEDTSDGNKVADFLGIRSETINIQPLIEPYKLTNPEVFNNPYDMGNMISRIRANVLSTKAATERKLLAGTGNKDEDFGVGYYTLFGDGAVHISPISGLSKRLVKEMAHYLGIERALVEKESSAGLEPGQTDFKDLGYDYDVIELVIEGRGQGLTCDELVENHQINKLANAQMKVNKKFACVEDIVNDIMYRNRVAVAKAEIIHPPSPDITLYY